MVMGRHRFHPPGTVRQRITNEDLQRNHNSTGTKNTKLPAGTTTILQFQRSKLQTTTDQDQCCQRKPFIPDTRHQRNEYGAHSKLPEAD